MHPQRFAFVGGVLMVAVGVITLIPAMAGSVVGLPPLYVETSYGLFLNLVSWNILNKLALIILGAIGIWASRAEFKSLPMSIQYARGMFIIMGVLTLLGLFQTTNTLFGVMPLYGNDRVVHGIIAVIGAYYGYALSSKVRDSGPAKTDFVTPM